MYGMSRRLEVESSSFHSVLDSNMPPKSYNCNGCRGLLPHDKPRIHCQICDEYNSCAACHVIESFSGLHNASHDYEIFLDGNRVLIKEGKTIQKLAVRLEQKPAQSSTSVPKNARPAQSSDSATDRLDIVSMANQYWGSVITEDGSLSPIFVRLLAAVFSYFDCNSYPAFTGRMEPSKLRTVLLAAGYPARDIPLLTYSVSPIPSGSDLQELDKTLALVYRALSLDYWMATREPAMNPYQKPLTDALGVNNFSNSVPMLSLRGFQKYFLFQIQVDPTETSLHINHLLQSLPPLIDSETRQPFAWRQIPRSCFPPLLDAAAEELRRSVEKQRRALQAWSGASNLDSAWRKPSVGDELYTKTMPGDFMHTNVGSAWRTGQYPRGY